MYKVKNPSLVLSTDSQNCPSGHSDPLDKFVCPYLTLMSDSYTSIIPRHSFRRVYSFRLSVLPRSSFHRVEFTTKFCVKVSEVVYISATTYQKAFIFEQYLPWKVGIHSMTPEPKVQVI